MTVYNFLLSSLSAVCFAIATYMLFSVIMVHKKIGKHFYFFMACLLWSPYCLFELLLSLPFSEADYLLFHRLQISMAVLATPFLMLTLYEVYFPQARKTLPLTSLLLSPIFILLAPFDSFLSAPVRIIRIDTVLSPFIYHFAQTNIIYTLWATLLMMSFVGSAVYFLLSKSTRRRFSFLFFCVITLIAGVNDYAVSHGLFANVMVVEYCFFFLVIGVFFDLLSDDRKTSLAIVELSEQLKIKKDEAERRLRITEIYTHKSIVESIQHGHDPTKFLPSNINITTLFSDIRDFTTLSESLNSFEVVKFLNTYFDRMNNTIIANGGEIDKLMGDCIMALFRDADAAMKSAIDIRHELRKFNEENAFELRINNGIGLNYGEVILGNIGSESKMDYTVVGDIVNSANRMEALTKYYKTPIIITEDLKRQLVNSYHIRFLDEVLVKGKRQPVKIYEVFDYEPDTIIGQKYGSIPDMEMAFSHYQSGDFHQAEHVYNRLAQGTEDGVFVFYRDRCRNLSARKEAGLLDDWTGVFEFMDK